MKRMAIIIRSVCMVFLAVGLVPSAASADTDTVETGRLLAILHDSGRVTIGSFKSSTILGIAAIPGLTFVEFSADCATGWGSGGIMTLVLVAVG